MKYLFILLLLTGCIDDDARMDISVHKDLINQLIKENKELKVEVQILNSFQKHARADIEMLEYRPKIEKECSDYLKLTGLKSPKLGIDYEAGVSSTGRSDSDGDMILEVGCRIYNSKYKESDKYWTLRTLERLKEDNAAIRLGKACQCP